MSGYEALYEDLADEEWVESEANRAVHAALTRWPIVTVEMISRRYGGSQYAVRQLLESMVIDGRLARWRSQHRRFQSICYYRPSLPKPVAYESS